MSQQSICRVVLIALAALVGAVVAPASAEDAVRAAEGAPGPAATEEVFKAKGLTRTGFLLVTIQEPEIHFSANSVRALKYTVATEMAARASFSRAIDEASNLIDKMGAELARMHERMERVKENPDQFNKLVAPYNSALRDFNEHKHARAQLRKKLGKVQDSQDAYNDAAIAAAQKADAATAAYAQLGKDAALLEAIGTYNKTAAQPVKLGPSGMFSDDAAYLKKCVADMIADGIPTQINGGVPTVDVIINGKTHRMVWDSGAAYVSMSAETAAEFGLHPRESDRTITSVVADGRHVQSKLIVVSSIRVGPFTAENVECLIDPPGPLRGPDLIGGSFQRHFVCRLDQQAGVLHLTPIDPPHVAPSAPTPDRSAPPALTNDTRWEWQVTADGQKELRFVLIMKSDGTVVGIHGQQRAKWTLKNGHFLVHWPAELPHSPPGGWVDTMTIAGDGNSMFGKNQTGANIRATRQD